MRTSINGQRQKSRAAFTLIELLVVVAIIAVLVAMLLPSLNQARAFARTAKCSNNQRQIMIGVMAYANDFNDFFPLAAGKLNTPDELSWDGRLAPYVGFSGSVTFDNYDSVWID